MIFIWGQIKSDCDGNFAQEHYGNEESSFLEEAGKFTWIRYLVFFSLLGIAQTTTNIHKPLF